MWKINNFTPTMTHSDSLLLGCVCLEANWSAIPFREYFWYDIPSNWRKGSEKAHKWFLHVYQNSTLSLRFQPIKSEWPIPTVSLNVIKSFCRCFTFVTHSLSRMYVFNHRSFTGYIFSTAHSWHKPPAIGLMHWSHFCMTVLHGRWMGDGAFRWRRVHCDKS